MFGFPNFIELFLDTRHADGSSKSFAVVFVARGEAIFCVSGVVYFFSINIYFFSA